ncbi:hypothetical protein TrCOL_g13317 [Triparma columacea]|uniref:Palmitoyltransferase n=1 Tax=Triparma columacea TaxID=722753 RepID=A0A9W7GIC1_9STRA|nr:hypothetical protein TrCOL_g13317 [Triparma columacea]
MKTQLHAIDFSYPDSIVLKIEDDGSRILTRPHSTNEEPGTTLNKKRPKATIQDLPPHLRNLGEPRFGELDMCRVCPTVAPEEEQLLSREYKGWMRLVRFPVESRNADTSATESRVCEIREDPSHAAPICGIVRRRYAIVSRYSSPNEDGWVKVGYRSKVGWARYDLFADIKRCRKFELFHGRNYFFCNGKIMTGPDLPTFRMSNLLILVPSVIWFAVVFPKLDGRGTKALWLIANACAFISSFTFLWLTATTDPGIIPRREPHEELLVPEPVAQSLNMKKESPDICDDHPLSDKTSPAGWKYCNTCKVYRPPRSKHCSFCDNCVDRFDHHCPWTSTCIGRRNYKYFTAFVWSCTLLCVFIFVSSFMLLKQEMDLATDCDEDNVVEPTDGIDKFIDAVAKYPVALGLMVFTFFAFWSVFGLSAFHSILICVGETTNENLRGVYQGQEGSKMKKEWDRGGCGNCCLHWFGGKGEGRLGDMAEVLLSAEQRAGDEASDSLVRNSV